METKQTRATFSVVETDHLWIEMSDGTRLAARLWRPKTPDPVPAILEYIPYRKADMVRARDERNHPFLAAHGYAAIRVDMRGSGDSEGHMPDMYAPAELADAREVINWLADQPWCNGRVGMFGTSWGGTASLQASVKAPKPLKAVIAVCATHDRFEDDIHYMGGSVLSDTFEWGATLPAILASPPTPNVGETWMALWRQRLASLSCPVENWLLSNERGSFWRHGSVIHQAEDLTVPILSVGGWSDRYSNSVMSLVNARPDLVWGVVGPWGHHYPDHGAPGPAIGWQHMALDWWDHWLKPEGRAQPAWPRLRVWLRTFEEQKDTIATRQGHWIESGPVREVTQEQNFALGADLLCTASADWKLPQDADIGLTSGDTGYFGRVGGLPLDQTEDDAKSLVFETAPLKEDLVIFGSPRLSVTCKSSSGTGVIVARLNDISETGESARIAYGVRNLALNEDLDHPQNPPNTNDRTVEVALHSTAYLVQKGHRLRLAVSQSLWPLVVSDPEPSEIKLRAGRIALPCLLNAPVPLSDPLPTEVDLPAFKSHQVLENPALHRWRHEEQGAKEIGWHQPRLSVRYVETDTVFEFETRVAHRLEHAKQQVQTTDVFHEMRFIRPDGTALVSTTLESRKDAEEWTVDVKLSACWQNEEVASKHWPIKPAV